VTPRLLLLLAILSGCGQTSTDADEYVLIEFAARLEEDYQKLSGEAPAEEQKKN
jgi:hypothetical protein